MISNCNITLTVQPNELWIMRKEKEFYSFDLPTSITLYEEEWYYVKTGLPKMSSSLPVSPAEARHRIKCDQFKIEQVFASVVEAFYCKVRAITGEEAIFVMTDLDGKEYLIDWELYGGGLNEINEDTVKKIPLPTFEEMSKALGLQFLTHHNNRIRMYAQLILKYKRLGIE